MPTSSLNQHHISQVEQEFELESAWRAEVAAINSSILFMKLMFHAWRSDTLLATSLEIKSPIDEVLTEGVEKFCEKPAGKFIEEEELGWRALAQYNSGCKTNGVAEMLTPKTSIEPL